ncbi:MAG: hypothetical protein CMC16_02495 [Flavobacteriaceae bacterium]|nr:hypothetical protein [Flavobacteriaceae bacterium]|tara:strand:+ start:252 stop:485 length:234 start_codon:yes stop_codon:yes gene_type:complete
MIRLYIIGVLILIIAILSNFIVSKLGVATWYDFLNNIAKNEPNNYSIIDYLWLFILYPLVLGSGFFLGDLMYNLFNK